MKVPNKYLRISILAVAFVLMGFTAGYAQSQDEFSFKVTNNTNSTIKKLLVAEAGKKYGYFDIGKGIAPGKTMTLVWDKSTNNEACVQYFKAVFADGSESEPVKFNFCEEDLDLEFN